MARHWLSPRRGRDGGALALTKERALWRGARHHYEEGVMAGHRPSSRRGRDGGALAITKERA